MNPLKAYKTIRSLGPSVFTTEDFSIALGISNKYGSKLLHQLSKEKLVLSISRGLWSLDEPLDPITLTPYLTAPMPSYLSLQSALYYHGLISQIPSVIYAISIGRTKRYVTSLGVYSIHHITPELFCGFDPIENATAIAQPEKALFDFFYLKAAKNRLFYALPETEIPKKFQWNKIEEYTEKILNPSRKKMVLNLMEGLKRSSS